MEQTDSGLVGLGATVLGYLGTVLGAFWNAGDLQLLAFFFTAFAACFTGIYHIVKIIKELMNKNK